MPSGPHALKASRLPAMTPPRGVFRAHRDNLSPATAHRRFALSLNLNAGYEGGYLRFPEYGPHLYRPEAGGALVFACSHLHEVTEVSQGRRFVLLSFLFGEGISAPSEPGPRIALPRNHRHHSNGRYRRRRTRRPRVSFRSPLRKGHARFWTV